MSGRGRVTLVGAGPGDPDLLTLRGARALAEADVVLADRLAAGALRRHAPDAQWVEVGKRCARGWTQEEVTRRMVEEALAGRRVVRLKGGDPMVFGRAQEEIDACRAAGIPVEVVPGVTAALAAAAALQAPLTDRERDPWVLLVPGHEAPDKRGPRVPWDTVAALGGTLAVYMGVAGLAATADALLAAGREAGTPVTLVARASLPDERRVETTLARAARDAARAGIEAPAILLVRQGAPLPRPAPGMAAAAEEVAT